MGPFCTAAHYRTAAFHSQGGRIGGKSPARITVAMPSSRDYAGAVLASLIAKGATLTSECQPDQTALTLKKPEL